jgi:cell division protein ZapA (FtsZ GTPase activity inhibitor)
MMWSNVIGEVDAVELKYEIQVGGRVFRVRSEKGAEHMRRLAGVVEHRMQELASAVGTTDSVRLAIMTALTFAEELSEKD